MAKVEMMFTLRHAYGTDEFYTSLVFLVKPFAYPTYASKY